MTGCTCDPCLWQDSLDSLPNLLLFQERSRRSDGTATGPEVEERVQEKFMMVSYLPALEIWA